MSFTAFTSQEIASGEPVAQELWSKVKDDFSDHESRLANTEAAIQTFMPIKFEIKGSYGSVAAPITGIGYDRIFSNIRITSARVFVITAGASGTLEVDIQYKRGVSAFTSIFSTRPSVAFGAGNFALSSNAVMSTTDLEPGDILRLDTVTHQVGQTEFHVYLTIEANA
jgi:hypothetical protein